MCSSLKTAALQSQAPCRFRHQSVWVNGWPHIYQSPKLSKQSSVAVVGSKCQPPTWNMCSVWCILRLQLTAGCTEHGWGLALGWMGTVTGGASRILEAPAVMGHQPETALCSLCQHQQRAVLMFAVVCTCCFALELCRLSGEISLTNLFTEYCAVHLLASQLYWKLLKEDYKKDYFFISYKAESSISEHCLASLFTFLLWFQL